MTAKIKGRELALIRITIAVVGRTHSHGYGKFLWIATGAWRWLSITAAAPRCPHFRTHNSKVVGSNPTPATKDFLVLSGFRILSPNRCIIGNQTPDGFDFAVNDGDASLGFDTFLCFSLALFEGLF
jgi:hypothetical protein